MDSLDQRPRKADSSRATFIDKPLLGFGPAGWILTPVALALATGWYLGIDLRRRLMWIVWQTLGIDAVYWITARWLPFAWFQLHEPVFNPIVLAYLLLLCHFSPRRVAWWKYALAAAWCLMQPALFSPVVNFARAHIGDIEWGVLLEGLIDLVGTGFLLWLVVRSWCMVSVALLGAAIAHLGWFLLATGSAVTMVGPLEIK